ncbi:MAG TPA: hypothetical protein VFW47_17550 [Phenylobacterium sp.]|nr:hypothetical protein [Phenylobacterium sp.]
MTITEPNDDRGPFGTLKFTPAEWRVLLEDRSFLDEDDNSYAEPRMLMGVPVQIVPDHRLG